MDNRDIQSIRETAMLDRVIKRTQPDPAPSWITLFFVAVFGAFMAWMLMGAIERTAFDLVNAIEVE